MRKEFKNLVNRSIFGLSEVETYIIRCIGNVYPYIAVSFDEIGYILNIDSNRVRIIYNNILLKINNYIRWENFVVKYGYNSIFGIDNVDLDLLIYLYRNCIKSKSDINNNIYNNIISYYGIYNDDVFEEISRKEYNKLVGKNRKIIL